MTIHYLGTELLRLKKDRERTLKRLHDAERTSGNAARSAATLETESGKMMDSLQAAETRAAQAEAMLSEFKRKTVVLNEENRRIESQVDQLKVMQCESDREKLQIESKLREAEFKHEAVQENVDS